MNEKGIFTLDLDLYRSKGAGGYGFYQTSEYDGEWLSKDFFGSIDEVSLIEDNSAEVIIKSGDLKQKAHIGYNSVSCQLTFRVNDSDAIILVKRIDVNLYIFMTERISMSALLQFRALL